MVVTDGGTSGAPTRFPPVCVWLGWAGKAAAWDTAHPRTHGSARGTNEEEEGGRKGGLLLVLRVLRAQGRPIPLSAGE